MSLIDLRTQSQFLAASTSLDMYRDADGTLMLRPYNLFPNPFGIEEGTDGEPAKWDLSGMPERMVAYNVLASRPGMPRRSTLQRQNTAPVPLAEGSWTGQQAWLPGGRQEPDVGVRPQAPEVEAVPSGTKGWEAGTYGLAEGYSSENGPTTISGIRTFTLLAGEYPVLKVPDSFQPGTKTWDIYVTRKNGTVPFCQRRVPIERLELGGDYPLYGPWRNRGRAPATNQSGIGLPPRPVINRDYWLKPSRFDILAGSWRPGVQIKNDRGVSVLSQLGRGIEIEADLIPKKVAGPGGAGAMAAASPDPARSPATPTATPTAARIDPREIRPSGKLAGNEYIGAEVDYQESGVVASINNDRARAGKDPLILTQALNRAAYRKARGDERPIEEICEEEGYSGNVNTVPPAEALAKRWKSVGIAIEDETVIVVGDYLEDDGVTELFFEHYDDEGNRTVFGASSDEFRAMVSLAWNLVSAGQMHWSYAGSYRSAVTTASSRWNALGVVNVAEGGTIQCAITDGSPSPGAMATTYSDGRMILSSYYMSRATTNAQNATLAHEFGHTLGFDHVSSVASVMETPIVYNASSNHETPTSYDISEYRRVYGNVTTPPGSGGDNPDPNNTELRNPPTSGQDTPDPPQFHYEWVPGTVKKNTALFLRVPRIVLRNGGKGPGGLKYTYYLEHEAPNGVIKRYRVVYRHSRQGPSMYFDDVGQFRKGIELSAYAPDTEPEGLRVGLIEEDFPVEDTTVLEAPDPTGAPDAPTKGGAEQMPAGTNLVAVQGVLEGGGLTRISEPTEITISATQMIKISPVNTVNVLKNAEFANLDVNGQPESWTPVNTASVGGPATNTYSVSGGVLTLDASSTTSTPPRLDAKLWKVDPEQPFTVGGSLAVSRYTNGMARVGVRQYDETRAFIADLFPGGVNAQLTQASGEIQFAQTYQPADRHPDCVYISVSPRLSAVSNQANITALFWNLRALPFASDVRRLQDGSFDATPDTPMPAGSFIAASTPPTPSGVTPADPVAPLDVLTFESGSVPAGWTESGTSSNKGVQAGAAIFGNYGYRVQDASGTAPGTGFLAKNYSSISGIRFALRSLYRIDQLPTVGYIRFHLMSTADSTDPIYLVLLSNGSLQLNANGTNYPITALAAGTTIDVEHIYVNGKAGTISLGLGINGERRKIVKTLNLNFAGRLMKRAVPGVFYASDPRARYNVCFDQVVVTEGGDILDRESPPAPSGYTPPPLDRPTKTGVARQFDVDGNTTKQLYVFLQPGDAPASNPARIPLLEDRQPVRPGITYGLSVFSRWSVFGPDAPGIRVWLEGEEGSKVEPILALSLKSMSGSRGWHPTDETDDYGEFTVPLAGGYTHARYEAVLTDGVYIFDSFLTTQGANPVFADRDAKRDYGRALSATGEFVMDLMPKLYDTTIQPGIFLSEAGVKRAPYETPVGVLEAYMSTSPDKVGWAPYTGPSSQAMRYLRSTVTLTGDGRDGPAIPVGGVFARTWTPVPTLLRSDGSHLPGVVWAGADEAGIVYERYRDTDFNRVGGRVQRVPRSDAIGRIKKLVIKVGSEAARQEIAALAGDPDGYFILEVPLAGGSVAGEVYRIVLSSQPDFSGIARGYIYDGQRVHHASADLGEVEVLERMPLQSPMTPAVSSRMMEIAGA